MPQLVSKHSSLTDQIKLNESQFRYKYKVICKYVKTKSKHGLIIPMQVFTTRYAVLAVLPKMFLGTRMCTRNLCHEKLKLYLIRLK